MSIDLAPSVRRVLQRVKAQLQKEQQVERAAKLVSMQQLQAWCDRHELASSGWFAAKVVSFDHEVIQAIEQTLSELGLAGIEVDFSQQDRFAQSDSGAAEYKSAGLAPMEKRVLMAQANCGAYFPEWVTEAPSQWVMDVDWQTLQLNQFADLVVVENRDAFYQYFALHPQRYTLPEQALNALVIYRGDGDESKGCKALCEACVLAGKNLIYFGDYDSAGLNFAVNGGYSHVMLALHEYLLEQANDIAQDAKQIHLAQSVSAFAQQLAADDPLQALLMHNVQKQKGLRQQSFKGALQIVPIKRSKVLV
jgi:hypothetical protein